MDSYPATKKTVSKLKEHICEADPKCIVSGDVCHTLIRLRSCIILPMVLIEGFPSAQ